MIWEIIHELSSWKFTCVIGQRVSKFVITWLRYGQRLLWAKVNKVNKVMGSILETAFSVLLVLFCHILPGPRMIFLCAHYPTNLFFTCFRQTIVAFTDYVLVLCRVTSVCRCVMSVVLVSSSMMVVMTSTINMIFKVIQGHIFWDHWKSGRGLNNTVYIMLASFPFTSIGFKPRRCQADAVFCRLFYENALIDHAFRNITKTHGKSVQKRTDLKLEYNTRSSATA